MDSSKPQISKSDDTPSDSSQSSVQPLPEVRNEHVPSQAPREPENDNVGAEGEEDPPRFTVARGGYYVERIGPTPEDYSCTEFGLTRDELHRMTRAPVETISEDIEYAQMLLNRGLDEMSQFSNSSAIEHIDKAIEYWEVGAALLPDLLNERLVLLSNLGSARLSRFERLGNLLDLSQGIESLEEAVTFIPEGYPGKSSMISNLAGAYTSRFKSLGDPLDLDKSIELGTEAAVLSTDSDPWMVGVTSNLSISYNIRFDRLGLLSDLEKAIDYTEKSSSLTSHNYPGQPTTPTSLGGSYRAQFERLDRLADSCKAAESGPKSSPVTAYSSPTKSGKLNTLVKLYSTRFEHLGQVSDLNKAIKCGVSGTSLVPDDHPEKPNLLNSLGAVYRTRFDRLGELSDLEKAIEYGAEAVSLSLNDLPIQASAHSNLGATYRARFERLSEISDMNKAIECGVAAISLTPNHDRAKPRRFNNLGIAYLTRFERLGEIMDLNKAIECGEEGHALTVAIYGDSDKQLLSNLAAAYQTRFVRLGELSDINTSIEYASQVVEATSDDHIGKPGRLSNLGLAYQTRFDDLGDVSDLHKAIEYGAAASSLTSDGDPSKPITLNSLGASYRAQFNSSGNISYLDKAIEYSTEATCLTPDGHQDKPGWLTNLAGLHETRFTLLGEISNVQTAVAYLRKAAQLPTGRPLPRFKACRKWAKLAAFDTVPSADLAYQQGMKLLPQLVWIGTTVNRRYELITGVGNFATEAASHAISVGDYDIALEWLEAGRSIVWGQIAQLRTPFDELSSQKPRLASELADIGRQLDHLGSRSSFASSSDGGGRDLDLEARSHVQLALKWDELLEEVRSTPGFQDFLRSPTAARLLSAAKFHPIAVINIHSSRCDALLIQPGTDVISHVPLTHFSADNAVSARQNVTSLIRSRKIGPRLNPIGSLEKSLDDLWSGVVKPVLDFLGYSCKSPAGQLPHITWCTTGLLSFLPLHAARSYSQPELNTFDLVISSYTPTLSALLANQAKPASTHCGILAVGQEHTPGLTSLPCTKEELAVVKSHAEAGCYLQLENDEATVEQVLDAMDQFSWVHMACHGSQSITDPTQSAFHLHDGDLTLATITRRSFTNKGLAFLSACQTATGDKNMPDEAVHLAAGMLMAGFPSVIGTMWSIADEDGPEVADRVYAELLKEGGAEVEHKSPAKALHQAVAHLRDKVGGKAIERWAAFIHIGS